MSRGEAQRAPDAGQGAPDAKPAASDTEQRTRDAAELAHLGYAQQLLREMGGFGNFAVSFSVISVLTGAVSLYGYGLRYGGPFGVVVGWALVATLTLPVAASLAQLASSFPTAGALYHWASWLGGRGTGWLTAWLNLLGQFAITAGIDWGLTEFLVPSTAATSTGLRLALYAGVLGTHAVLNHVGIRTVNLLARVSAWYHVVGVALVVGAVALLAPHRPVGFLLDRTVDASVSLPAGASYGYAFLVSLLMAGWTFTGYDASAHVSEETQDAARSAPRGIFLSVLVSAVCGGLLVLAVTLSLREPAQVADPRAVGFAVALDQAFPGRAWLSSGLTWLAMGAMWFCGLASLTSNSRMIFAFARDGGMPLAARFSRVSPRYQTPVDAVWLSAGGAFGVALLCLCYGALGGESVADVLGRITAASTVGLYLSYGLPIAAGLWARRTGRWRERGPWDLGRSSDVVNLLALAWIAALSVISSLPPNGFVAWLFAAALVGLGLYWGLIVRHRFRGPPELPRS
jgi:amino acid transporter